MFVVQHRKIFFALSALFVVLSITAVLVFGLTLGIDFTGGSITEVSYTNGRPSQEQLARRLTSLSIGAYTLQETGESGYLLRTRDLNNEEHEAVLQILSLSGELPLVEERFNSIGPSIGEELRNKALLALLLVVFVIILFVAFAFRKVSEPVSSWKYGMVAIFALLHDIVIPVGIFAVLGQFFNAEIDALFVTALLVILGYSVNDTIVVFDRVRENLRLNRELNKKEDFKLTVGKSLNQTYGRSINVSVTTLFVLLALFFLGPATTQNFTLVLITGVIAGTYSSIFLATPLLIALAGSRARGKEK